MFKPINRKRVTINAKPKGIILLANGVNTDTSNQLINVSKRTRSQPVCFNKNQTTLHCNQAEFLYQLMYLSFICYKFIYMIKAIMLRITAQLK